MPPTLRVAEDGESKRSGWSALWFLLFLFLVVGAGGYLWWRSRRRDASFQLHNLSSPTRPLRLSTEDGPSAELFITNNLSTDSLPAHVDRDVPYSPAAAAAADAAAFRTRSPLPSSYTDDHSSQDDRLDPLGAVSKSSVERSPRSPLGDGSEDERDRRGTVFSIADDDD